MARSADSAVRGAGPRSASTRRLSPRAPAQRRRQLDADTIYADLNTARCNSSGSLQRRCR